MTKSTLTPLGSTLLTRRTLLTAAAAGAVGVSLAACAPSGTNGTGTKTLKLWSDHSTEELAGIKQVVADFEKAQGGSIKVEILNIADGGQYYTKLKTAAVGNNLPDVFYVRTFDTAPFATKTWTRPIDDLIERDRTDVAPEDFWAAQTAQFTYEDKVYALPYDFSNIGVYINKSMFEAEGVPLPDASWTWDDYYATAAKFVKKEGGKQTRWGTTLLTADWYMLGVFASNGGKVFSDDLTECVINSTENVATLQAMLDAMEAGAAPLPNATPAGVDPFSGELAAMYIMGSFATTGVRASVDGKFDWDVAPLPNGSTGTRGVSCAGGGWSIAGSAGDVDASWELVKALASPAAQEILIVEPTRSVPGRQSSAEQWAEQAAASNEPPASIQIFVDQMKTDAIDVHYPTFWQDFQTIWGNQIGTLGAGGEPATILANVQDETNKLIARS
jgi:ABC-type glycerol-3-phosphate transport system substrate-binding protein